MLRSIAAVMLLSLVPLTSVNGTSRVPPGMARVAGGSFRPLYAQPGERTATVSPFAIDTVPVSSADFLRFTVKQPRWSRSQIPALFADDAYLSRVIDDATRPVTQVSWFAANAYCRARGARLPTTNEWEYVARASETDRDAASQPGFRQRILELALASAPGKFRLGSGFRNVWGVRDMHGGVMEWTADFLTIFSDADARENSQSQHTMTCSAGAVETGDASDYAAFMRYALRRSIEARNTVANVGFRCAVSS